MSSETVLVKFTDKRMYFLYFFLFLIETICCDLMNRLVETVQMKGQNIYFYEE